MLDTKIMGYKNREIERKSIVLSNNRRVTYEKVVASLNKLPCTYKVQGNSGDEYWKSPRHSNGFLRVRSFPDGSSELTFKEKDNITGNLDRSEIDVKVQDSKQLSCFMNAVFGKSLGEIHKKYTVFVLEDKHTTVSVYQLQKSQIIYLEVEAKTVSQMNELQDFVNLILQDDEFHLDYTNKSLYEIIFLKVDSTA